MEPVTCKDVAAHIFSCDHCQLVVQKYFSARAGSVVTDKKSQSSRLNGLKGGRPKKMKE